MFVFEYQNHYIPLLQNYSMKHKKRATGLFDFLIPSVIPSFVQGAYAETVFHEVRELKSLNAGYDSGSRTMTGSSTFIAARVDSIVRGLNLGIRVATLRDLSHPEVMKTVKNKFYSDTPAIIFRSIKDGHKKNKTLTEQLAHLVEQKNGKLELPVLVTGFDIEPSEDKNYGFDITPRKDFTALSDERLGGKYDGRAFSTVDEEGLPNFDRFGYRIWHAQEGGLSWLYLGGTLNLDSQCDGGNLADSNKNGRIILIKEISKELF